MHLGKNTSKENDRLRSDPEAAMRSSMRARLLGATALAIAAFVATAPVAAVAVPTVGAHDRRGPVVTPLTEVGSDDFVIGSTIGPDGALYVTDGMAGAVLRIDRRSGRVATYAAGLPPKAFPGVDIGGPVDVAFAGRTAYVLVTLVSGTIFDEPFGDPEAANGLYRIETANGSNTLVADLGEWSVDNPPELALLRRHRRALRPGALPQRIPGDRWAPQPGAVGRPPRFDRGARHVRERGADRT